MTVAHERPRPAVTGPFSGVPFLVKDIMAWPGLRWSMGSRLYAANVARQHTPYGRTYPFTSRRGGLPIGTHFAAAPGADALLLGLAYQLEQACPWKDRWPPYSIPALF